MLIDTVHTLETPEGIDLELYLAGPAVRALAAVIDFGIRVVLFIVVMIVFGAMGTLGFGLMAIAAFLLEWFYPVFFEVRSGATPGKKMLNLAVVHGNGTPITWRASVLRNLMRTADFFPALYVTGLITTLVSHRFQRLGDILADTLVVHRRETARRDNLLDGRVEAPQLSFTREEQSALIDFAERSGRLSGARSEELAAMLAPLTGENGGAAREKLSAWGRYLASGREPR